MWLVDEESIYNNDALQEVKTAIGDKPEDTYTITISCGKLTTGVTIKPWTAVLMLSGSKNTSPQNYMQTIFRVQSPAVIGGRQKTQCYVFDFAPDRTLKMIAESIKISCKAGGTTASDRESLGEFLNFCPIISVFGTNMAEYNVDNMMQQLKRVYVDRVVNNGFEDQHLYNNSLLNLSQVELEKFADLQEIIGQTKAQQKTDKVEINNQGFGQVQIEKEQKKAKKEGKNITEEEARRRLELDHRKKQRSTAISILRGISIRMPMLIYSADIQNEDEPLTLDRFVELVDDQSWEEFMPKGVTKDRFAEFKQYYDEDIFTAAGKQIRELARAADSLPVLQRIQRIVNIFASFRNPDKETVLTPWRVVNMHMSDCLGGYSFFDDDFKNETSEPHLVDRGLVTNRLFENSNVRILEINSKSGLYPLYVTYSVFMHRCRIVREMETGLFKSLSQEKEYDIWFRTLRENIFVICKTEMARKITRRTLVGFTSNKINSHVYDDLINQITNKQAEFISKINSGRIFKQINNMKFDAIVGNPPYQLNDGSGASSDAANPIYHSFVKISKELNPRYISLIMPSKWMIGGKVVLKSFRKEMIDDQRLSVIHDYEDSGVCFNGQHIDGGIMYFLWDEEHSGKLDYSYKPTNDQKFLINRYLKDENSDIVIRDSRRQSIVAKASFIGDLFKEIVSLTKPFGIRKDLFNSPENYPLSKLSNNEFEGSVKIYGVKGIKGGARRTIGYIDSGIISKNTEAINKYKLFFTTSYSSDAINPPETIKGQPNEICTETFLLIGPFDNEIEQSNCYKYINSNFFKILLFFGKGTMQVSQEVFRFVPLQDFTPNSDIDWTKSIVEIDQQLYTKYGLQPAEIQFIESMIKPM